MWPASHLGSFKKKPIGRLAVIKFLLNVSDAMVIKGKHVVKEVEEVGHWSALGFQYVFRDGIK